MSRINKSAIAKLMRDMQKEFDKHPIKVPMEAESPQLSGSGSVASGTTIYYGPVIHGNADGAQLAWGNDTVHQTVNRTEHIAPGFEVITQAIVSTLQGLPAAGIPDEDLDEAQRVGREALEEVTQPEPDRGKVRRAVAALKGFLAPIATGLAGGAAVGAQEWAKTAIGQLGTPF